MGFEELFARQRIMAILRGLPTRETVELAERAWELGIELVEVTVQTADAMPSLRAAIAAGAERGRTVGAGTVTTVEQVTAVAEAGAGFTVAPGLDLTVLDASTEAGLPHLPGVATPSEIQLALGHGVEWLKAFPATVLGTAWFQAMVGPFSQVKLVATGGLDTRSAPEYLAAGARAVALGSALSDPEQVDHLAALAGGR
ncbi:bifunctional 4-hydroxy-2-oxoglutarate aldolase/2-dehydro-3-deoxy-phosphogluconate aldolase [Salinactinospora qingdaonensis]|uniref:Bifunctional 4-hydroxy-2-oxoglutarate aldolase/2-dehydro-3-deoxy-phosphogluconate aldolase n=1 Tax=Salinactinospora qingdaonensis TaxID=702744 RepID=A0ABP7F369_9ACTN